MSELFTAANSEWMDAANNPATSAPLTMFAWIKPNTNTQIQMILHMGNVGKTSTDDFELQYQHGGVHPRFLGAERSSTAGNQTISHTDPGVFGGLWRSVFFVVEGAALRKLYVDGVHRATGSANIGLSIDASTRVGRGRSIQYLDIELGPCGIIPYAMTAKQIAGAALGVDPQDFPKASSGAIWQMIGGESPVPNVMGDGSFELTVQTAPTAVETNPFLTSPLQFPGLSSAAL